MHRLQRATTLAVAVSLVSACHRSAPPPPAPPTVQVAEVIQRDVPISETWIGVLDGFVNAEIKPQVAGYIVKQVFREGTLVRQGEPLFLVDPRNYKDLADQAGATLDRDLATLHRAQLDVQRDKELIAGQAMTQQQFDHDLAAEREAAASVAADRAALRQAQLNHGWTQVTAPITGIAGIAQIQVGNLVNTATSLTTVSQVDPIKAQFNISELEYLRSAEGDHWAEPGQPGEGRLELILQDGTVYPHRGTVIVINRQVNGQTGTIALQGSFPNPGNLLRPGQYARVRAVTRTRRNALLVPQRAVNEIQGSYLVARVGSDGEVDFRPVQVGEQVGSLWIIEKGLSPGDKVIVSILARLRPGMPVHPVLASADALASQGQ
ncbi:MAG TPA: efflux RND transporter periplasmic adaptor subunit [Gemmatimonadales bacterium]|nr:efflux RND transporter periplasmic adaptor subunit [Gemmatimonadales bacterium]